MRVWRIYLCAIGTIEILFFELPPTIQFLFSIGLVQELSAILYKAIIKIVCRHLDVVVDLAFLSICMLELTKEKWNEIAEEF